MVQQMISIKSCTRCKLHKFRDKMVIGRGEYPADLLFMGEAPGYAEDTLGQAFIGPSGKLLNVMLNDALKQSKLEHLPVSFFTNTILCRPCNKRGGEGRKPSKEEVAKCLYNVQQIIEQVNAVHVVLIGKEAEKYYGRLFVNYYSINHPSYLLRGGGIMHPWYERNVRILTNVFNCLEG